MKTWNKTITGKGGKTSATLARCDKPPLKPWSDSVANSTTPQIGHFNRPYHRIHVGHTKTKCPGKGLSDEYLDQKAQKKNGSENCFCACAETVFDPLFLLWLPVQKFIKIAYAGCKWLFTKFRPSRVGTTTYGRKHGHCDPTSGALVCSTSWAEWSTWTQINEFVQIPLEIYFYCPLANGRLTPQLTTHSPRGKGNEMEHFLTPTVTENPCWTKVQGEETKPGGHFFLLRKKWRTK